MFRIAAVGLTLLCVVIATSSYIAAATKYQIKQDPQVVAVAQAAFTAMGGTQAVTAYQDSLSSGTVTVYSGGTPASYPITMKSKGLRETRVEIQKANGTNVRIVNQGQGAIVQPDGSIRSLYVNDTFYEHVKAGIPPPCLHTIHCGHLSQADTPLRTILGSKTFQQLSQVLAGGDIGASPTVATVRHASAKLAYGGG